MIPDSHQPASQDPRLSDLQSFYDLLGTLMEQSGGPRRLGDCTGGLEWPLRGVYFFLEDGEYRHDSGGGPRVVRVGTHALKAGSRTTLWNRLSQHRGSVTSGRGNHRGSIFRLLVGAALLERDGLSCPSWGSGSSAPAPIREQERDAERRVSGVMGRLKVVCLDVPDSPGPESQRGVIERGAIALLSNAGKSPLDRASRTWLGNACPRERVRASGLWNQNHVDEAYDPAFLQLMDARIHTIGRNR